MLRRSGLQPSPSAQRPTRRTCAFLLAIGCVPAAVVACDTYAGDGTEAATTVVVENPRPPGDFPSNPTATATPTTTAPPSVPPADPGAIDAALTPALAVNGLAVFQAVKVGVLENGGKVTAKAPIIAGRPGLIRVYVAPEPGFSARKVKAIVQLSAGGKVTATLEAERNVSAASSDAVDASCFDFPVTAAHLSTDTEYRIALTSPELPKPAKPASATSRYPQDGSAGAFGARAAGALKVVLVPVLYGADGSNRAPDTSAAQVQLLTNELRDIYPVTDVNITVRAPVTWPNQIAPNAAGWGEVLNRMIALRGTDNPGKEVYYYGIFSPAASFQAYCNRGCVAGLSGLITNPNDSASRASVGLGFPGQGTADTMAHELGHAHGRPHAPCGGVAGPDPGFPYAGGGIGVPGYRLSSNRFVPASHKDLMGYCNPTWISDYNYEKLFRRVSVVSVARELPAADNQVLPYHIGQVDAQGRITVGPATTLREPPQGPAQPIKLTLTGGKQVESSAVYYAYDHIPGGMLFLPDSEMAIGGSMQLPTGHAHDD